ncbi:phosphoribosyltransferase-like protein [Falsiroseomonas sp.]|uniref:phosphoribosyltransferase-like protein n=1 Tax=Falsiroseomonas sp. TaxID=2870721 RepID=UPI003F6FB093
MRRSPPRLSETTTGQSWLKQFNADDQSAAADMLDAMLLLNAEQVSRAIRSALTQLGASRPNHRRRLALYAERKLGGKPIFTESRKPDRAGRVRLTGYGRNVAPIQPIRGGTRVGSEGLIANLIAQVVKSSGASVFVDHPGPDRIRGKSRPTQTIVIVTDLIGSGRRVLGWLDAFWAVRSVKSWVSLGLVDFAVVSAVSTDEGRAAVRRHRLKPRVLTTYAAPVISAESRSPKAADWRRLIETAGPSQGRGADREGYGEEPCLVAFSYRLPNNTPALIHGTDPSVPWRALYEGGIPEDLHKTFGMRDEVEMLVVAAESLGVITAVGLTAKELRSVLVLSLVGGRLKLGQEEAIARETQLPLPEVEAVLGEAKREGLLDGDGRLTQAGQLMLLAGLVSDRKRPTVHSNAEPYYPKSLRVPPTPV